LEQILFERNQQDFAQAAIDETLFTVDHPLYSLPQFRANTSSSEDFRLGKIDPSMMDLDDEVLEVLDKLLPKQDNPAKISEEISIEEVISGYKKWNESTTTGGRHLGHCYKAWTMRRQDNKDSMDETYFFQILVAIYCICLRHHYPLKR
jgi:hypothetical protein